MHVAMRVTRGLPTRLARKVESLDPNRGIIQLPSGSGFAKRRHVRSPQTIPSSKG